MNKFNSFSFVLLILIILLPATSNNAGVHNLPDPPDALFSFLITVETTHEGVHLTCKEGCDWIELSFSYYERMGEKIYYGAAIVDQMGVSGPVKDYEIIEATNEDFLFEIRKTEEGVSLKGIKGMAWKSLSFDSNYFCPQDINEMGMVEK